MLKINISKNLIKILFLFLILYSIPTETKANRYGTGELKLSSGMVDYFIQYIRGEQHRYPSIFYTTLDGTDGVFWYCSEMTNCRSGSPSQEKLQCLQVTGKECAAFARKRTVKWENGINSGKGKTSRINSKWSDQEIRDKLKELGFVE